MRTIMTSSLILMSTTALAAEYPYGDHQQVKMTWYVADAKIADVNGDGKDDIVALESGQGGLGNGRVLWYQNKKKGKKFVEREIDGKFSIPNRIQAVDVDGDKDIDIVVSGQGRSEERNGGVQWFENLGKGKAWKNHKIHLNGMFGHMQIADFDGDGDVDIALVGRKANNVSNGLHIYENEDGKGKKWSSPSMIDKHANPPLAIMDYDGDGDIDILGSSKKAFVLYRNGGGPWKREELRAKGAFTPGSFDIVDFNADGKMDFVLGGQRKVSVFLSLGDGNYGDEEVIAAGNTNYSYQVKTGDVDGDGKLDVIVSRAYALEWFSYDAEEEEFTKHKMNKQERDSAYFFVADFDKNGMPEVGSQMNTSYAVGWLWNKGKKGKRKKK